MRIISYDPLWEKLIDVKMTKTELAEKCKISRPTVARMSKNEVVSLEIILKICNTLDCDIQDVVSMLPEEADLKHHSRPVTDL